MLILAGEAVFILPFVLARIFRPTFLEVFQLSNTELGACFSTYGIVAFLSYLFGGTIADKYPPKYLIAIALIATAAGGFVLANEPNFWTLQLLYGYWGFTTIFLFWAAMVKATRVIGGKNRQGLAFGLLDGGRGLVAAGFGSVGILIFSFFINADALDATANQQDAFQQVIYACSSIVALIGVLIVVFLKPAADQKAIQVDHWRDLLKNFSTVIKIKTVWLLMIIILCAYVGYKITDIFSLYASKVMGYDEVKSAKVGTYLLYIRPFVGVGVGLLADRTKTSLLMIIGFMLSFVGCLFFASGIIDGSWESLFLLSLLIIATGVYAFRTLYFAALQEGHIPLIATGTAVGLISLVGYTPDIFMGPAIGILLDGSPGELGHQHVFMMCAGFMLVGLAAAIGFYRVTKKPVVVLENGL
ncbi:MFS transporter [Nonlabens marinus]|uniref:Major facilitator superfamily (MFS) profile domain-containing protein n=1 Tax=Nonlabens marinus S1-08 TaxID=1454201 RepID=W8W0G9_9FLAO|nr:MFS transporter [Nonlabens marinus]BAO56306.1 hypothetical protein NMS_2297 [Nonlabens marinus S1-08]